MLNFGSYSGGISASDANNGLGVVASKIGLGTNPLIRDTSIDTAGFGFRIENAVDVSHGLIIFSDVLGGGFPAQGIGNENAITFLTAIILNALGVSNELVAISMVVDNAITGEQTGFGTSAKDDNAGAIINIGSDLYLAYINLVGVPDVFPTAESITADNGATATIQVNVNSVLRITPLTGDWTTATSITGDTTGFTADISNLKQQEVLGREDGTGYEWLNLSQYAGDLFLGYDVADKPTARIFIKTLIGAGGLVGIQPSGELFVTAIPPATYPRTISGFGASAFIGNTSIPLGYTGGGFFRLSWFLNVTAIALATTITPSYNYTDVHGTFITVTLPAIATVSNQPLPTLELYLAGAGNINIMATKAGGAITFDFGGHLEILA